jgi:hypothetical protein
VSNAQTRFQSQAETTPNGPPRADDVAIKPIDPAWFGGWRGAAALWAGLLIPQLVLLGPALLGRTVDLPVDLLAAPHVNYLPTRPEFANVTPHNPDDVTDLVLLGPALEGNFAARELRAGRLPLWQPGNFAGAPFMTSYSPFAIPYDLAPHPVTLAWIAILKSLVLGLGMWQLLRREFALSYWPAAIGSWCAPLVGFMTVWHGFTVVGPFCWLPWLLWAVGSTIRKPRGFGSVAVAIVTALALISGHTGVSGLVVLTCGLYAVWLLAAEVVVRRTWQRAIGSACQITLGWMLGFALAAPYLLPLVDYGRTGARLQMQSRELEQRPPEGLRAVAAILVPEIYGGMPGVDWQRSKRVVFPESSAGAYAGLLAALWLAPLAWCNRQRRSQVLFLSLLIVVSVAWTLNLPGFVQILRSDAVRPFAGVLSFNRWVLAAGIALLILAAIGLEQLLQSAAKARWWFLLPVAATVMFGGWCVAGRLSLTDPKQIALFARCYDVGAVLAAAALVGWATTAREFPRSLWLRWAVIVLLPLELFWFAWNERRQADIALYYPRIPVLEKLATLAQGRIWGVSCFPPNLNLACGLEDARGYDAIDPGNYIRLFSLAMDRAESNPLAFARTQYALPLAQPAGGRLSFHPVVNLLNVRYLLFRQPPPPELSVILQGDGYWVAENEQALPRVFVPRSVEVVKDDKQAIAQMQGFDFDPSRVAFVTNQLSLPAVTQGEARVRYPAPTRAEIDVDMKTAGLVLLADLWDAGWHAKLDGVTCPTYRVNVALRGYAVPPGKHQIICTYDPPSLHTGLRAAALGAVLLLALALAKAATHWRVASQHAASVDELTDPL